MLTAKQTKFVQEINEGGSQSSAYRKAYHTSQMVPKTVWEESSLLRRHPKVAERIIELEAEKEARAAHAGALTRRQNTARA
jgi:phage terminase small subunit